MSEEEYKARIERIEETLRTLINWQSRDLGVVNVKLLLDKLYDTEESR